ncbi:hypothetical protein SLS55_010191 [Diplodia seriata]|uniref:Heterokaryon incompatibility domain-containing protein n=1 Tax=Diplodia seriata TaxID=420778 RepID=A0ABR3BYJ7_9PEZI
MDYSCTLKFRSHEFQPIVEDWISWDRMRKWIPDHQRGYEKSKDSKHFPSGFRLIHVKDRRVISIIEPGTKFVALSYVWGACVEEEDGLLEDNKAEFEKPDGLKRLPRGIEDAIKICQKLDYLYLWVDRYCIIQDEGHPEKQDQINAMAVIYSSAELTLINASGSSMHEPIPGVTTNRKSLQSKETMFGFEFTNAYPDFRSLLKNTTWFKRGWTYQEAVLSRRKLIFTPFETFFEDSQGGLSFLVMGFS